MKPRIINNLYQILDLKSKPSILQRNIFVCLPKIIKTDNFM